jgi:hypothetical protein
MSKAAQARPPRLSARDGGQGFSSRRTGGTPQTETRGERRSSEKGPFMDGNQLKLPFKSPPLLSFSPGPWADVYIPHGPNTLL